MTAESFEKHPVAVVTGGGRGIGAATAEALALRGLPVLVCARTSLELDATVLAIGKRSPGARVRSLSCDLADPASAKLVFDAAESAFGAPVRLLVNNAALGVTTDFLKTSSAKLLEEWDRTIAINARAPFLLAREMIGRIAALGSGERGGAIVNLGSLGGIRSTDKFPGLSIYVASKFAIAGLTEALAVEGRAHGVRVNAVAPGAVDTEMLRKAAPHLRTDTRPEDVARAIVGLLDPSVSGAVTGSILEIHSNL